MSILVIFIFFLLVFIYIILFVNFIYVDCKIFLTDIINYKFYYFILLFFKSLILMLNVILN